MAHSTITTKGRTTVLVRYVVQDDSGQLAAARRLVSRCVSEGQPLFIPVTVTLEVEWVLRARFVPQG